MTMIKLVARPLAALSVFAFGTLCSTACSSGPQGTTDAPDVTRKTVTAPPGVVLGALAPGRYYGVKNVVLHGKDAPSVTEYWVSETERETVLDPSHSYQVEAEQVTPCPNATAWQLFDAPNYGGNVLCIVGHPSNGNGDVAYLGDYSDDSCSWNGSEWICTTGLTWAYATRSWKGNSEPAQFFGFLRQLQGWCNTPGYEPSCFRRLCVNPSNPNVSPVIGPYAVGDYCAYYSVSLQF
jgi:hypothetical protein